MTTADHRRADHLIDRIFLERWSPRDFTDEVIAHEELLRLFEAGAPGSIVLQCATVALCVCPT